MDSTYELEYTKSYDGKTLVATPIKGHPELPVLRIDVTPEELPSVIAYHRTRTMDPAKPGITAYVFGKPGNVQIIHHDRVLATVGSHEEALNHQRDGEQHVLRTAFDRQPSTVPQAAE